MNNATNEEAENPPLVLAALKLPEEIFNEESESVDEVDFCQEIGVSEQAINKLKHKSTFHALLQHSKIDVNCRNRAGITALHVACSRGNSHMVNQLLQVKKIKINIKDKHDNTPLHAACGHGNQNVVESLIKAGADYQEKNSDGKHPLHVAVVERNLEAVITILCHAAFDDKVADLLCARDKRGHSVFLLAVLSGDELLVKFLLDKKIATISDKSRYGYNCFHYAASINKEKLMQMIYAYNESISLQLLDDANTLSHYTPLHFAAKTNQVDALRFLIAK